MSDSKQPSDAYAARLAALDESLRGLDSVAIAFSGGVDSSVLLHAAHARLGARAVGVIADSPSLPRRELEDARAVAAQIGARLVVLGTHELDDERYRANAGDRCYFCKSALFDALEPWARENGFRAIAFGEIADDALDVRPGGRAARERHVVAPLAASGFTKDDVRHYAREHGLDVADKPASACLASRLPIGTRVTRERLARVERAEAALADLGFSVLRVRDHGDLARVEFGRDELARARVESARVEAAILAAGFARIEIGLYLSPADRVNIRNASQS